MSKGLALFYGIVIVALIVMWISSTDNGVALSDGPIIDDGHRQRFTYPAQQTNFENGHLPLRINNVSRRTAFLTIQTRQFGSAERCRNVLQSSPIRPDDWQD